MHARGLIVFTLTACFLFPTNTMAWDYLRHRLVNRLALASLPKNFPAFVREKANAERIQFLGGEPDRWRNQRDRALRHLNGLDHYFDVEYLAPYQIKPAQLSHFRYEFVEQMAAARTKLKLPLPNENADRTKGHPGFLPWAINEHYLKLVSAFSYLKVFEEMGTPEEIANARANVIYRMGILSHFVGDAAQPLHTTKHFNGWIGDNPNQYTTSRRFHSWIDGGFLNASGGHDEKALLAKVRPAQRPATPETNKNASGRFQYVVQYILGQHALVEPLYQLNKTGNLSPDKPAKGKAFLQAQLSKSGRVLGNLWFTAWQEAPPDKFLQSYLAKRKLKQK
jgi:hypothetical protein